MSLSAGQCRAGRGLVDWSQADLSSAAKVGRATIADFEAGKRVPYNRTLADIRRALEEAGIVFLSRGEVADGGPGVRLRQLAPDHPKPVGPATDAVDAMDAAITKDRAGATPGKRSASLKETGEEVPSEEWERFEAADKKPGKR